MAAVRPALKHGATMGRSRMAYLPSFSALTATLATTGFDYLPLFEGSHPADTHR